MPVPLPCPPGCASSIAVFSYFVRQRPQKRCITLNVALYMSTRSCWTVTELEIVPIRNTTQHREASMFAMYSHLHMVPFGPGLKYRLCL